MQLVSSYQHLALEVPEHLESVLVPISQGEGLGPPELGQCFFSGLREDFQMDIFKILAAILHLGNVQIAAVGNERSSVGVRAGSLSLPGREGQCLLGLHWAGTVGPAGQTGLAGRISRDCLQRVAVWERAFSMQFPVSKYLGSPYYRPGAGVGPGETVLNLIRRLS